MASRLHAPIDVRPSGRRIASSASAPNTQTSSRWRRWARLAATGAVFWGVAGCGGERETTAALSNPEAQTAGDAPAPAPAQEELSSAEAGRRAFSACGVCHSVAPPGEATAIARIGPNLYGIVGREAAKRTDFDYSAGLRASGVVWTRDALDAYIAGPSSFIQGTLMAFPGEDDGAIRQRIIDYLDSLDDQRPISETQSSDIQQ